MKESKLKSSILWVSALMLVIAISLTFLYVLRPIPVTEVSVMGETSDITGPILEFPQFSDEEDVIRAMALNEDESILYVGGSFSEIGGVERYNLAAIDTSTYEVTNWDPSPDDDVFTIEVYGDAVYVGGDFYDIGGTHTGEFAKINADGSVDTSCLPDINSNYEEEDPMTVYAIEASSEYIYVGGSFNSVGEIPVADEGYGGLVRLSRSNCEFDETWRPSLGGYSPIFDVSKISAIKATADGIYVGGVFEEVNGTEINGFAKINLDGTLDTSCNPDISLDYGGETISFISSIELSGDYIYLSGIYNDIGDNEVSSVARINASNCVWDSSWKPLVTALRGEPFSSLYVVKPHSSGVFIGGSEFNSGDNETEFSRIDNITGFFDSNWDLEVQPPEPISFTVHSIALATNHVYIGGSFQYIGDENIKGLAAFNIDTLPPTGGITINQNATYTTSTTVGLSLDATDEMNDVTEMMVCNNLAFGGCSWEAYASSKAWVLDSTLGTKTVYVKFRDSIGHVSNVISDNIVLHLSSIRITDIGLITNIPNRDTLRYYFTSVKPVIRGLTQSGSTVYFTYNDTVYQATANSSGEFSISFTVDRGVDTIEYYAKDVSSNQSTTKTLILTVGVENFPDWLLEDLGLESSSTEQEIVVVADDLAVGEENTEEVVDETDDEDVVVVDRSRVIRLLTKDGKPMVGAYVEIGGYFYVTDESGEFQTDTLDYNQSYTIKVEYNGVDFEAEIFGITESQERIDVILSQDSFIDSINPNYIYFSLLFILFSLFVVLVILLVKRKKEKDREAIL